MLKWIYASERLPKPNQFILGIRIHWPACYWVGYYDKIKNDTENLLELWMEIPDPPKERT